MPVRRFFEAEIADEVRHAGILADFIAALGGSPTTTPVRVTVEETPLAMLHAAHDAEASAIERYVLRRQQATEAGEHGLAIMLDEFIADETRHRDGMRMILDGWNDDGDSSEGRRVRAA